MDHKYLRILVDFAPVFALIPALLIAFLVISTSGVNPFSAVKVLFQGALGSPNSLGVTAIKVTPMLIVGLGVAIGIRAGYFNLGGEGQIYIGGLVATVTILYLVPRAPGVVQIALGLVGGFVGGALWMLLPAILLTTRGVTEVITTLLMNFPAINIVTLLILGPIGEKGASFPKSPPLPDSAELPIILPNTQMHAGILIAILLTVSVYVILERTSFGLDVRAVGEGKKAARFTGIKVTKRSFQVLLLSGGLAGIAGSIEIIGLHHRLPQGFSPGYGFDGIAVALLGAANPFAMIPTALFFGMLRAGAPAMERSLGVPSDLIFLTQGLAIVAVAAGYGLRAHLKPRLDAQSRKR